MIDVIMELEKNGVLKKLTSAGFISTKLFLYYEIYLEVDKRKKTTKLSQSKIVADVADVFRVSEQTIYRAIYLLKPKT